MHRAPNARRRTCENAENEEAPDERLAEVPPDLPQRRAPQRSPGARVPPCSSQAAHKNRSPDTKQAGPDMTGYRVRATPPLSQLRSLMYRMVYRHSTQLNSILRERRAVSLCARAQRRTAQPLEIHNIIASSWLHSRETAGHQAVSRSRPRASQPGGAGGARHSRVNGRMTGATAANASAMTQICMRLPARRRPRLAVVSRHMLGQEAESAGEQPRAGGRGPGAGADRPTPGPCGC